jgi:hypothetical protein
MAAALITVVLRLLPHPRSLHFPGGPVALALVLVAIVSPLLFFGFWDAHLLAKARKADPHRRTRTRAGRQVWFERWGVGYNPVHWKGWLLVLSAAPAIPLCVLGYLQIVTGIGHPEWRDGGIVVGLGGFALLAWAAERHCS